MSPLRLLRTELRKVADPTKAPQMQAYMKSVMPYHGVPVPAVRKLCKSAVPDKFFETFPKWEGAILDVWRKAKFREERYCALNIASDRRARDFQTPKAMKCYEEMVTTGAWWDFVDDIASKKVGPIVLSHPETMKKRMEVWSRSRDMWKRRTAILCQLSFKEQTDLELLYRCIEASVDSKEFFLQKAIGWALREYAWRDPDEVVSYVKANKNRLAPLSKREALNNVLKAGKIASIP